jgi:hypothetical protein
MPVLTKPFNADQRQGRFAWPKAIHRAWSIRYGHFLGFASRQRLPQHGRVWFILT